MLRTHNRVPASVIAFLAAGRPTFVIRADAVLDPTIEAHRARQAELLQANESILAQADAERRELSAEENRSVDDNSSEFDRLDGECVRRERVLAQNASLRAPNARRIAPEQVDAEDEAADPAPPARRPAAQQPAPRQTVAPVARVQAAGTHGFRSLGDFAVAVRASASRGGNTDNRLLRNAAATSITQESVGQDGGYAVPPDFRTQIMTRLFDQDSLASRCDIQTSSSNNYSAPTDETTPWGTGGVKAYWTAETSAITQSKPLLSQVDLRLHKLAALVPVTEEMADDASAIGGYLASKTPEALDWALSYALIWGTGAGQPFGVMNSAALVSQAAESAQTADTVNAQNVVKMLSRLPPRSRSTAVWLIHPDAEPQLPLMTLGQMPVYMPPGGLADAPLGRLLGRPVIPHQVCATVGDLGDILLVDLNQYLLVRKTAGINAQVSMHLWFDQDIMAYKFTLRVAGQPWWAAAQSPRAGANTQSPFVALAAR